MPVSHFIAKQAAGPSPGTGSHGLSIGRPGTSHQVIIDNRWMRGVDDPAAHDPAAGSPTLLLQTAFDNS